ncbi:MAG: lamin tail domain-containing protein [Segetibacter sp.]|nr:lamin tail domain-containing protein [Segetibacter sp.]
MKEKFILTIAVLFILFNARSQVIINEIYGGGGNSGATYKNDFIELYNNSTTEINLDGWSVQYASAAGTTWSLTALTGTIAAQGYFLIKEAAGTGGTTDLPAPDITGTLNLSATSGKVALVNNVTALTGSCPTGAQIIDFVGFGSNAATPPNCFETSATLAPSNSTSIQRSPEGFDSNDNSTDFKIANPTPVASIIVPDVTPPSIASLSPANIETNVAASFIAAITFNETIKKETGSILVKTFSDNSIIKTIDVSSPEVIVSGKVVSFSLSGLTANTAYYIEITSGAFTDTSNNIFAGITDNSTWKFTTGSKIFSANFNSCFSSLPQGFTQFSVTGTQVWSCTNFGRDAANPTSNTPNPYGVQTNGFDTTNVPNEDWLISPAFNLTGTTYPLLAFWSRTAFNGAPLQLKVSTDYSGSGDPQTATWTDLNGRFPKPISDVWTESSSINLSAYKQPIVYVAFVYTSTNEEGARWTLDDISIDNSATPPPASLTINTADIQLSYAASGSSVIKNFIITGNDITSDIIVSSTDNFLVSANGTDFSSSVTIEQAEANNVAKTVYVKFTPIQNDLNYTGSALIKTSGLVDSVNFKGTSIDPVKTLEVVNWNIEWFGSPAFGPSNDNQQEQNVRTILQNIGADIYGFLEVVDTARLGNVVRQLAGGYSYVVSNFGSHTNPNSPVGGSLGGAQKLAFVYKTAMFNNVTTTALLSKGINTAADVSSASYNNWSSGRYPFMMSADVTLNGITKNVKFILIHAKANTSPTTASYNRRKAGADSLYALLNASYATDNIVMLGDFNDDLDQTITAGINPPTTSYISFVNDSINYPSVTFPLSRAGKKSTVSYNDVIDHVILSNEMKGYYMNNTASILTDAAGLVSGYGSTTTDHYPVFTRYSFDPTILPITLLEFEAFKQASNVRLTWKTAQEINTKEFIVERSKDALHFEAIGKVNAAGNSGTERRYIFNDNKPFSGTNFYRLKQVDKDDRSAISKVVKVYFGNALTITLSPNPAKDLVTVTLNNFAEQTTLQVLSNTGQVLKQQIVRANTQRIPIKINGLSPGVYLVKAISEGKIYTVTLVIQ